MMLITLMRKSIQYALLPAFVCFCFSWLAADDTTSPHHLVGHEEAALLLRIQDVIDDWDPRKLENPLFETSHAVDAGNPTTKRQLRRPDLAEFIADVDAAEALGKAFFWEMQAGSDFTVRGNGESQFATGTACASCHYRHGADARNRHTFRIPYVAWDKFKLHEKHPLEYGQRQRPFSVDDLATQPLNQSFFYPLDQTFQVIIGSQGVESKLFKELKSEGTWYSEISEPRPTDLFKYTPEWSMFGGRRQITARNSPSIVNSGFSDRLFHDGRAESTFNGFSIFGDFDRREVIHRARRVPGGSMLDGKMLQNDVVQIIPVHLAITNAALASQAVGPIVNDVEMSYVGRQFPNVAHKLLNSKVLAFQTVDATDSVLGKLPVGKGHPAGIKYEQLIKQAFRSEWWDDSGAENKTPLVLLRDSEADGEPVGRLMEANFSLYWGLSIMLYEASLVSNQSPFDAMMRGDSAPVEAKWNSVKDQLSPVHRDQNVKSPPAPEHQTGSAVFQHGFRVFLNRGCVDCHDGPFFSELYVRKPEAEKLPIHYSVERALLPNSRSDSYMANLRQSRQLLLRAVAIAVARIPGASASAKQSAVELEELRHTSYGRKIMLKARVGNYLTEAFYTPPEKADEAIVTEITDLIFGFEKSMVSRLGDRHYFTEDERIAMAEAIGGPLLLEKMRFVPELVVTRPKLPISGPLASEGYAFYDASFYALGVSPPRYDRGIGARIEQELPPKDRALLAAIERTLKNSNQQLVAAAANPAAVESRAMKEKAVSDQTVALGALQQYRTSRSSVSAIQMLQNGDGYGEPEMKAAAERLHKGIEEEMQSPDTTQITSIPGQAYRFRRAWNTERFESAGARSDLMAPAQAAPRTVTSGPKQIPDEGRYEASADTSWWRNEIPYGDVDPVLQENFAGSGRREQYYFLARSRRLVFDEQHWGFRKPFLHDNELAFWGAFKTPTLRNVELTAPYMHNGRFLTLQDVLEFYDDEDQRIQVPRDVAGTPEHFMANPDKHPAIRDVDLTDDDKRALLFFLLCLTDDRVRYEEAPFDHPSLCIPNGYAVNGSSEAEENFVKIDQTGAKGHPGSFASLFPTDK